MKKLTVFEWRVRNRNYNNKGSVLIQYCIRSLLYHNRLTRDLNTPVSCDIREFGERNVCRNGCDKNTERTGARTLFLPVAVAVSCCLANPVENYNGCCGRVWLWREFKMAADIDVYLFALMEGDIDEEEYLLLIQEFDNCLLRRHLFGEAIGS